jgi:hypothetical protein
MEKTLFTQWFEIRNKEHMKAYAHYLQARQWPKHFIPADVEFESTWNDILTRSIVDAFVKEQASPVYRKSEPRSRPEFS